MTDKQRELLNDARVFVAAAENNLTKLSRSALTVPAERWNKLAARAAKLKLDIQEEQQ